jgi:hypothetical protein
MQIALSRLQPTEQYVSLASPNLEVGTRLAVPRLIPKLSSSRLHTMPAHRGRDILSATSPLQERL